MDLYLDEEVEAGDELMDVVEAILQEDDRFVSERADDGDVQFGFKGAWCEAVGYFSWREELPAMLFTVSFGLAADEGRRREAAHLIAMINENLWLGHFDLWAEDGSIVFRHAVPMIGRSEIAPGEVQALLASALDAADRFYPAFGFLLNDGKSAEDAAFAALFETAGEA
ncbi:MAG: YbjN domain-containing protein [Hyphomonadaceae bacterium]|nr:YbjN domain-containing protein [Hyphomonadaceae bacterium]